MVKMQKEKKSLIKLYLNDIKQLSVGLLLTY